MGTMDIQKQRLIKKCKIVLGEDFNKDFIYEDVDFTKPSTIKEAYKLFEANDLERTNILTYDEYDEVKNFKNFNKNDWKRDAIQKKYVRIKPVKEATDLEEAPTDKYMPKDISMALRSAGIGTANVIKVRKLFKGSTADDRYTMKDINLALMSVIGPANIKKVIKALRGRAVKESTELEEATMSQGYKRAETQLYSLEKSLKVGSNLNKTVNKTLGDNYDPEFRKMEKSLGQILNIWEEIEMAMSFAESTNLEEAPMGQTFYGVEAQLYSLEKSLKVGSNLNKGINKTLGDNFNAEFRKMEKSLGQILNIWEEIEMAFSFAESIEEAKNATVRELRQMLFKIDSSAADKFRRELFNIDKQDSPATSAQIKKAKTIIGNRFGKDAFVQLESSAKWIIYDKKTGKQLSPSKSWRKWQGAKAAASKIGGDAEVADMAWYHDNKAKLMGEAKSDKQQDIESLEKMIKNPDPRRFSQYGGKEGYLKMLNSKLAKLKA